jgi:hypothetical protein
MKRTVYVLVFLTILVIGLTGGPQLWAAPGQQNPTVPTRTPIPLPFPATDVPGVTPETEPNPPSPPPANTPVPADPGPAPAATEVPTGATPQPTAGQEPQVAQPGTVQTVVTVPTEQRGGTVADPAATALPPTPAMLASTTPAGAEATVPASAPTSAPVTSQLESDPTPPAAASPTEVPSGTVELASQGQVQGNRLSPMLIAGFGLLVVGVVVVMGVNRRG